MDAKAQGNKSRQQLDQTLMLAYAEGDAAAFDRLYSRHKTAVYRFFIRQNLTTAVAEDLCHDTWLKLINNRAGYQANALFTTYLFTIARRIAIDHAQKKSVLLEQQQNEENLENQESNITQQVTESNHDSQLDVADNQTLAAALKQQIAALPYEQREVFLLKQEAGFSIDDIAEITFQNKEKVKSCWRYALQKMRKGLSFYGN
ncbi:sigma-70 family RNA polymerase sigma factor [Psychromonas ossibalaenae]|uniref:sigma-70 family RNA polymerase sigma factor n=1 Tax=Psychromonas ossibalaenae TaxID=444922 RepID=UPI00036B8C2E|nr:sigma-70 family RNA polymerase sigma factor [Psychromonas ossibalaenae]